MQNVEIWTRDDDEVAPTVTTSQNKNISHLRRLRRHQLLLWYVYLRSVGVSALMLLSDCCLYLNPREISAHVFYDEQVITSVNLRHRHVVTAQEKLRHYSGLSCTACIKILHIRHVT